MSDYIPIRNKLAKSIFDQWLMINWPLMPAAELYKCTRCFCLEIHYKFNLGMCPEELTGINMNCRGDHKNGTQAYLAVDATPLQGGIAFYTCTGFRKCFYYQPNFIALGIEVDRMRPTDFEMINLLIALFVFKNEILNHKTVRIITDNNYLRERGKMQRHAVTEAIAAILQWCDNFGCTINEIFRDNTFDDVPFLAVADRLSRNKEIKLWARRMNETNLNEPCILVGNAIYDEIPSIKRSCINEYFLATINKILEPNMYLQPESSEIFGSPRFRRMMQYLDGVPIEFLHDTNKPTTLRSSKTTRLNTPTFFAPIRVPIQPELPNTSEESWVKPVLIFAMIISIIYLAYNNTH